jgi:Domain of unknown function (DUF4331)
MSSHREAPEISKDPVADSTDLYAFVSPDRPSTLTLIANYIPLQEPAGGPNFTNYTGPVQADLLRLNTSIPPTPMASGNFSTLGVLGGDLAGFPNGRRVTDDVVTIELRAIAGAAYPLIDPKYQVDKVVASLSDGLTGASVKNKPLAHFPYMGVPYDGYHNPS